ncbi:uncharacterized protein LOC106656832 [Trichogramma pretiosum]|uniref:uncharacterized protein LOC106656832 n=1 Tax=Trichogramma pretiosum TaxID=7493 RepID=UPI000C719288|nr:uncharacterized protein LOC106656832 [Trichogramma pretiosum]
MKLQLLLFLFASFNLGSANVYYQTVPEYGGYQQQFRTVSYGPRYTFYSLPIVTQTVYSFQRVSSYGITEVNKRNTIAIGNILAKYSVDQGTLQSILQFLKFDSYQDGRYTQYLYNLLLQITYLTGSNYEVRVKAMRLVSQIILEYMKNNSVDEQWIFNQINSLNIHNRDKKALVKILVTDFKRPEKEKSKKDQQKSPEKYIDIEQYGENAQKVMNIFIQRNIDVSTRKILIEFLTYDQKAGGMHAELILKLINQIFSWNISAEVQKEVLELIVIRIREYQTGGKYSNRDIITMRNKIEKFNVSNTIKNKILYSLIINFSEKRRQIQEIIIVNNLNQRMQKQFLDLISKTSAEVVAYYEYILQLMIQVVQLDISNDVRAKVIELIVFRVIQFELNGGSIKADEQTIQNQILQLNTTQSIKNNLIQLLLRNFKGQVLHPKSTGPSKPPPQTASVQAVSRPKQHEDFSKYGKNIQNVMKLLIEKNVDENSRKQLLKILASDSAAGGTYAEWFFKTISKIFKWNTSDEARKREVELLIFRIEQYQKNGKYSDSDIIKVRNEVEKLNIERNWKNMLTHFLITDFKGRNSDVKDENRRKIKEIMIVKNVTGDKQKKIVELLSDNSNECIAYIQYIMQLMRTIISWTVTNDIQTQVTELLVYRILQFQIDGGLTKEVEQLIKQKISQLNTTGEWKNRFTQFLLTEFKGQDLTKYTENVKKVMKAYIENNVDETIRLTLLQLLKKDQRVGGDDFTSKILTVINNIFSFGINNDAKKSILELLVIRIKEYSTNGPYSDPILLKKQIYNLNVPEDLKWNILYTLIFSLLEPTPKIAEIMILDNVNVGMQKLLLTLIADNSAEARAYSEYIFDQMMEIVRRRFINDIPAKALELFIFRILQFELNGGSNKDDEQWIRTQILRLNIEVWTNQLIKIVIEDFKGQLLHSKNCRNANSESNAIQDNKINTSQANPTQDNTINTSRSHPTQDNKINTSSRNQGSCIGSCSGGVQYLPHADCSKFCQCSNGRPIVMPCPATLQWDTKINNCNYPDQVQCPS